MEMKQFEINHAESNHLRLLPPPIKRSHETIVWILKITWRHIIAAAIFLLSVAATPFMMELAYLERGYRAYGGEFMFIPLGIAIAVMVLSSAPVFETARREHDANINVYPLRTEAKD